MKPIVIAFYLPQYHPIEENNNWFGEGFTEWTNVGKAKPLFKGHYQPRVPADLGYYDLRIPEVREKQAELAKEAGVTAFCYYHYWFGNGHTIMERPLTEVIEYGKPDFPFCLCWANHNWAKKEWNPDTKSLRQEPLITMAYPGINDAIKMFNHLLPAFKDKRYLRIDGRLAYMILDVKKISYFEEMKNVWNQLAKENGLPEFFFMSYTTNIADFDDETIRKTDVVGLDLIRNIELKQNYSKRSLIFNYYRNKIGGILRIPQFVFKYKDAMRYLLDKSCEDENKVPVIVPNWDWSPRRGAGGLIFTDSTPSLFKQHVKQALELIKRKPKNKQILILKSWNEWGEGNYMEPDLKFGKGYIQALKEALEKADK